MAKVLGLDGLDAFLASLHLHFLLFLALAFFSCL
jgi:hypothetical protein